MIKTTAIKLVNPEPMMVTWDTGRRCNYDCSYCESSRHDNVSAFHDFDELKNTFDFIKQWCFIYNSHRNNPSEYTNINFTGGEPTLNPAFWSLVDYIKNEDQNFQLNLTTNGAWNKKFTQKIVENFSGITISYHAEGHPNLKKIVLENIFEIKSKKIRLQVNLMFHVDYWDECIEIYYQLKAAGINVKPRPIGDGNTIRRGWFVDKDGSNRRTSHDYTKDQQTWFWNESEIKQKPTESACGESLGRSCCGGRCLQGKVEGQWQEVSLVNNYFKGWNCMVDWYFLHIDQHTGNVYHHQTCQAKHDGTRGAIGNLTNTQQMLDSLNTHLKNPKPIICPNLRCGCGMCIPKAESQEDFDQLWSSVVLPNTRCESSGNIL